MDTTFVPNPSACSIIDIRWQDQYATGHIVGSINIPSDRIKGIKDVIDGGDYRVLSRRYDLPIEVI